MTAATGHIRPFSINIPEESLDDLRERLDRVRWASDVPGPGAEEYGVSLAWVQKLTRYWRDEYDWRGAEARLNAYPQFITEIDGQDIHFLHVKSPVPGAVPRTGPVQAAPPLTVHHKELTLPTLPWTTPNPAPPGTQAYAMASRFEVRSVKDVPRFFLKSLAAWRQVRSAPGCLGASLIAQPLRRVFFTLSAWQDRDALYAFAATQPHRGIMASLRPTMRSATFTFWDVPAEQLPLTWDAARQRLAEQARADGASVSPSSRET